MNGDASSYDVLLFLTILTLGINVLLTMGSAVTFVLCVLMRYKK
jgi:hypothetical protein